MDTSKRKSRHNPGSLGDIAQTDRVMAGCLILGSGLIGYTLFVLGGFILYFAMLSVSIIAGRIDYETPQMVMQSTTLIVGGVGFTGLIWGCASTAVWLYGKSNSEVPLGKDHR